MKRYRLTARAQIHGEIRDPGYVFTLADGEVGPHKTVSASSPDVQIADHIGGAAGMKDVPLYVELSESEESQIEEAEAAIVRAADEHAELCAKHGAEAATSRDDGEVTDRVE